MISIHALHEESDVTSAATRSACSIFQSTLSMRRATAVALQNPAGVRFQSTLSMRRATRLRHSARSSFAISIHALHEESDHASGMPGMAGQSISIHALHEESDRMTRRFSVPSLPFQSTLSMRRATHAASSEKHGVQISIHALHEESD